MLLTAPKNMYEPSNQTVDTVLLAWVSAAHLEQVRNAINTMIEWIVSIHMCTQTSIAYEHTYTYC